MRSTTLSIATPPSLVVVVHRFETRVEPHGKTATFFHVPPEVMDALGPRKRVPVWVTVNGHSYRSTVAPMGGSFLLPLNRENRMRAGVAAGEMVEVVLERDDEPRVIDVPEDLAAALAGDDEGPRGLRPPLLQPPTRVRRVDHGSQAGRDTSPTGSAGARAPEGREARSLR